MTQNEDNLYNGAIEILSQEEKISVNFLQKKLRIGYNRAVSLIEQLEKDKIISSCDKLGYYRVLFNRTKGSISNNIPPKTAENLRKSNKTIFEKIIWVLFFIIFAPIGVLIFLDNFNEASKEKDREIEYIMLCENKIKLSLKRPATYKSGVLDKEIKKINGDFHVRIKFEVKNGLGLPIEQIGICIFNDNGLLNFNIYD